MVHYQQQQQPPMATPTSYLMGAPTPAPPPVPSPAPSVALQTSDLWLKIDTLHLNYLSAEENTKKIDIRKKLEGFIHQYLCLVPQERKFCNSLTSELLLESARWVPSFSAVKAAQAFEAVEKYAANLLNQPWRKEFREVKQYGGFYKHNIECALSGAERLFHQMGYRSTGLETLKLDESADHNHVTTVARDCILAYVECQILVSIVQGVSAQFPCTWEEALNFRREHIGTPEQAVRSLVYVKNQMQYQQTSIAGMHGHPNQSSYPTAVSALNSAAPDSSAMNCSSMSNVHLVNEPLSNYSAAARVHSPHGALPSTLTGGKSPIPTGRLIEVDSGDGGREDAEKRPSVIASNGGGYNHNHEHQQHQQIPLTVQHFEEEHQRKPAMADSNGVPGAHGIEDRTWDFVYRQQQETASYVSERAGSAEMAAAAVKDRGNCNGGSDSHDKAVERQLRHLQLQDTTTTTTSQDDVDAVHHRLRGQANRSKEARHRHHKSGEKLKSPRHSRPLSPPTSTETINRHKAKTSSTTATPTASPSFAQVAASAPSGVDNDDDEDNVDSGDWHCYACTFANPARLGICDMCGKSRDSPDFGREDAERRRYVESTGSGSASGSRTPTPTPPACQKCTLVNKVGTRICEACGATLPTAAEMAAAKAN